MKRIEDVHSDLFHYTSLAGLKGIIEGRTLWCTNAKFLNDGAELVAFRDYLPGLIRPSVERGLSALLQADPDKHVVVEQAGGFEATVAEVIRGLVSGLYSATFGEAGGNPFAEPYLLSFCTPETPRQAEHGLLSQWRGYGKEGGYSLVFDSHRLSDALLVEAKRWPNLAMFGGDVIYSDANDEDVQAEFGENLKVISDCLGNWLATQGDPAALEPIYHNLLIVSCRYKHWGFREEREVRIVAVPPNKGILEEMKRRGLTSTAIKVHYPLRNGKPVPTIHLFDDYRTSGKQLPIRRIIVGPGGDRNVRKRMVEEIVEANGLSIPVTASEIPYIDRAL